MGVFDRKSTRTRVMCLLLTILLLLAGCTSNSHRGTPNTAPTTVSQPETTTVSSTPTTELTSTRTPTKTSTPQKQSLSDYAESKGVDAAGLSKNHKLRAQRLIANFSEKLPENKTERRKALLKTANTVCENDQKFERTANISQIEDGGQSANKVARRLSFTSQIINERFTDDVPVSDFKSIRSGVSDATKYAPILGSYNRLSEASCKASKKQTNESIKRFQVSAIMFGVDTMLVVTGGLYKPAFASTRYIMNSASKLGFYRLRYVCGNRCWALAWSETHWALRGQMIATLHGLAQFVTTSDLNITKSEIQKVAELQGVDSDTFVKSSKQLRDKGERIVENESKKVESCISNVSDDPEKAAKDVQEEAEGFVSGVLGDGTDDTNDNSNLCESNDKKSRG